MRNMNDNVLVQNCKISVSMLNSIFRSCFELEYSHGYVSPGEEFSCSSGFVSC